MGHTTPNNLKISIRLYELNKLAMREVSRLSAVAVMSSRVVQAHRNDLLQ